MEHFLVFTARKFKNVMGEEGQTWEIAGIFSAANEQRACLRAMQKTGHGTAFAVAGFAFGVDMEDVGDVGELGVKPDAITRLERMGNQLFERMAELSAPGRAAELNRGDDVDG